MTTDNPSSVPLQPSQYNSIQGAQVSTVDACYCLDCSLSYILIQPLGGLDHLTGVGPGGPQPYPAMNYVSALPPTRYTSRVGYDHSSHLATVRVRLQSHHAPFADGAFAEGPCDFPWSTPARRALCSHDYCKCSPAPPPLFFARTYNLSYRTSGCRRFPTATPPVTLHCTM
jgi:hypothetical protein